MRTQPLIALLLLALTSPLLAQQQSNAKPEDTEVWQPEPKVVTPGATPTARPPTPSSSSTAKTSTSGSPPRHRKAPAKWDRHDGTMLVSKTAGNIETKRNFRDYQLHIEWRFPRTSPAPARPAATAASSSPPPAARRRLRTPGARQLQQQDLRQRTSREHLQTGIPLANPNRKPGEWQIYDVAWTAPVSTKTAR